MPLYLSVSSLLSSNAHEDPAPRFRIRSFLGLRDQGVRGMGGGILIDNMFRSGPYVERKGQRKTEKKTQQKKKKEGKRKSLEV